MDNRAHCAAEDHGVASTEEVRQSAPKLDRRVIEQILGTGKRLLVQGAMGIHASDGLSGKVAAMNTLHIVGVGTISGVLKSEPRLRSEIRRGRAEAPRGFIGLNLMAAINRSDFDAYLRISFEEGISFIVQGAGISRDVVKRCRDVGVPFAGIVSSGRLATMYEKWGAEFLVAEGRCHQGRHGAHGLFYTGQSVTRIPDRSTLALPSVREIFDMLEATLGGATALEAPARAHAR